MSERKASLDASLKEISQGTIKSLEWAISTTGQDLKLLPPSEQLIEIINLWRGITLFEISECVIGVMKSYKEKVNEAFIWKEEGQTLYSKPQ